MNGPKRIMTRPIQVERANVSFVPSPNKIIEDALIIISSDIEKLRVKTGAGMSLEGDEARKLHGHIKALVDLQKNEREADKAAKDAKEYEKLTDAELLELAQKNLSPPKAE